MSDSPLREIAAVFGIQFDTAGADKAKEKIETLSGRVKALVGVFAGSAIFMAARAMVDQFEEVGSAINDASDRLGVGTQAIQELQFAFGQAGVRGEQVNAALSNMSVRLEQARTGAGPAAASLRALGVHATDAAGHVRPINDVMSDVAEHMDGVHDPARRVQIAMGLFGGVGRRLVGVLHSGSGGLADMREQFAQLGGGITEDGIAAADDYGDAMGRWQVSSRALQSGIATRLLPILTKITDWVSHGVAAFSRMTRGTNFIAVAMAALGAVIAVEVLPPLIAAAAPFLAMAAAVAAAVLVVDDLIAMFRGGHSVIGHFIDKIFGIGSAKRVVVELRDTWHTFMGMVHEGGRYLGEAFDGFMLAAHGAVDAISNLGFVREVLDYLNPTNLIDAWGGFSAAIREVLERLGLLQRLTTTSRDPGNMSSADERVAEERVRANAARSYETQVAQIAAHGGTNVGFGAPSVNQAPGLQPLHIEMHVHTTAPAHEVARHAVGMIQQRLANQHDANHPLPPRE